MTQGLDAVGQLKSKIKKPYYFKNKTLPVERSYGRKYNFITRFYHNLTSRYNYYYNANRMLDEIYEDFELYPKVEWGKYPIEYYAYDYRNVSDKYALKLDSIIYKCNAGIVLHDLRSKWQDDFYYLLGQTYYLRNNLDTSLLMFEFLYNSFIPDKKGNVDIIKNKRRNKFALPKDLILSPEYSVNKLADNIRHNPKRNDALMWIIRILTEMDRYFAAYLWTQAILKESLMPSRIRPLFSEVQGYWHYRQKEYLEAAQYLAESLSLPMTREEKARRNFLVGQLYDLSGQHELSATFFLQSYKLTLNPELEIYARLYHSIEGKYNKAFNLDDAIQALLKLRKKERFEKYRGLIYYNAALMELQRDSTEKASYYLQKAISESPSNIGLKNKAYYTFFKLHFNEKKYVQCSRYMDSVSLDLSGILNEERRQAKEMKVFFTEYGTLLRKIAYYEEFMYFNSFTDSTKRYDAMLQRVVAKTKKVDDNLSQSNQANDYGKKENLSTWYFENSYLLEVGKQKFNTIWGGIANADNWRTDPQLVITNNNLRESEVFTDNILGKQKNIQQLPEMQKILADFQLNKKKNLTDSVYLTQIEIVKFFQYTLREYDSAKTILDQLLNSTLPDYLAEEVIILKINLEDKMDKDKANVQQLVDVYYEQFPKGKYIPYLTTYYPKQEIELQNNNVKQEAMYNSIFTYYQQKNWTHVEQEALLFEEQFPHSIFMYQVYYFKALSSIHFNNYELAREILQNITTHSSDDKLKAQAQYLLNRLNP